MSAQRCSRGPRDCNKVKNRNRKEEAELSLLSDDLIVHIENPKESTEWLLGEFRKFAKYKVTLPLCILAANN